MILLGIGGHFAQAGNLPGKAVDVFECKIRTGLLRNGQQVQHRVGRAAHGDVERHGVKEGGTAGDGTRQHAFITFFIIAEGIADNQRCSLAEELRTIGVRGHDGAVARQREADGLRQAVHRIGREHSGAAAAARAGSRLNARHCRIVERHIGRLDHGVDQVETGVSHYAGFHRTARHKDRGNIQPHGGHQHARRNLVAIADADHGIGLVRLHHIFYTVGDDLAGGKRIEHAVVTHGDTVIHGNSVEFGGIAAQFFDFGLDQLAGLVQMRMPGHELGEGIDNGNDRLADLLRLHSGSTPQGAGSGHATAFKGNAASKRMFHFVSIIIKNPLSHANGKGVGFNL